MISIKVRGKIQVGMQRVGKLVRMMDLQREVGVAEVGIEGEGGAVGIRPGEAMGVASSKCLFLFLFFWIYILIM
jgi:hypothetical protein